MAKPRKAAQETAPSARPFTAELRSAIAAAVADGRTPYSLAIEAGIDPASLHRFLSGERSLSLESADKLASVLRLQVIRKARPKKMSTPKPLDMA